MKAWIVTWDGLHEGRDHPEIVAIYNFRRTPEQVREMVEQLYIDLKCSQEEKVAYAADPKKNPYPAQKDQYCRITCGHNPWLYARYVDNIRPSENGYTWDEPDVKVIQQ